ncbi:15796_t:CDS:2, partial [Funneliformis mosseae]
MNPDEPKTGPTSGLIIQQTAILNQPCYLLWVTKPDSGNNCIHGEDYVCLTRPGCPHPQDLEKLSQ